MNMIQQKKNLSRDNPLALTKENPSDIQETNRTKMLHFLKEFECVKQAALTRQQQDIFNEISTKKNGLHIITGVPGSGKTFLIKYLTTHFIGCNKNIILTASTGAAQQHDSVASQKQCTFNSKSPPQKNFTLNR